MCCSCCTRAMGLAVTGAVFAIITLIFIITAFFPMGAAYIYSKSNFDSGSSAKITAAFALHITACILIIIAIVMFGVPLCTKTYTSRKGANLANFIFNLVVWLVILSAAILMTVNGSKLIENANNVVYDSVPDYSFDYNWQPVFRRLVQAQDKFSDVTVKRNLKHHDKRYQQGVFRKKY